MKKNSIFIAALLILTGIFITACTSTPQIDNAVAQPAISTDNQVQSNSAQSDNSNIPSNISNRTGMYRGNITDEQRQVMFQQRQQAAIDACKGKNIGDSCTLTTQRNSITGICKTLNETVQCTINRTMNRSRGYNPTQ